MLPRAFHEMSAFCSPSAASPGSRFRGAGEIGRVTILVLLEVGGVPSRDGAAVDAAAGPVDDMVGGQIA